MRTEEEIKEKLKEHQEIRDFLMNPFISPSKAFVFQEGFINALKWVLNEGDD